MKNTPDSLVMNIKLPKTNSSDQTSNVNNHKIVLSSNVTTELESDSNKKIVPKIVISNNRIKTKTSTDKPVTANGLNTSTFVKCKDNEGRVLLVPQSSLTFKNPPNAVKQNKILSANSCSESTNSTAENNGTKSVPSYILKVVPNQNSGQNQVFLIPLSEKKSKSTSTNSLPEVKSETPMPEEVKENSENISSITSAIKKNNRLLSEFELDNIK